MGGAWERHEARRDALKMESHLCMIFSSWILRISMLVFFVPCYTIVLGDKRHFLSTFHVPILYLDPFFPFSYLDTPLWFRV